MPTYIIVKTTSAWNPDDPLCKDTGYIADILGQWALDGRIVPPKFVQFVITDDDDFMAIKATYLRIWQRVIDWEFVAHDYSIDGHRLRVFTKPEFVSVSGLNSLTRAQVENYLGRWNATVKNAAANEVVFDTVVYDAICSEGFWGRDTVMLAFAENSYNATTGVHEIECDYRNDPVLSNIDPVKIEQEIAEKGGTIIRHPTNKVTFQIARSSVFDVFKDDVRQRVDGIYARRTFKVLSEHIDMALASESQHPQTGEMISGSMEITRTQWAQYVYNRLDD